MANMDTAAKRYSTVGIDLPWPALLPIPTGTVDAAARLALLRKYSGFAVAATGPAYGADDLTTDVSFYLRTLLPGDQTTEFRQYADGVRATTNEVDLNTAMWLDLNF